MSKGNPQKSDTEKQRQGTLQKVRMTDRLTYEPLHEIPDSLEPLDESAKKYYHYICEVLLSNGTLTAADIPSITQAAVYYGIFSKANEEVMKGGYFQITQSGYTSKNAHIQAMTDAYKAVKYFENLYGFNLSSRGKINIPKTEKEDPFDNL